MIRTAVPALALIAFLAVAAPAAVARSGSTMTLTMSPAHPRPGSMVTFTIRGTADEGAVPIVALVAGAACPAKLPLDGFGGQPADMSPAVGTFTRTVRVPLEPTTKRVCAYLQPTGSAPGDLQYDPAAAPLARATLVLGGPPAGPLRGEPHTGVSGGTRTGDSGVSLDFDGSGRRIVRVRVVCGGDARHPGSLGKEFIGKRFSARVSLPLTWRIRWSGLVTPDNSRNYDAPVPAAWTRPTRFAVDVKVTVADGVPRALVGTGVLSSPGLPCPRARRYVAP